MKSRGAIIGAILCILIAMAFIFTCLFTGETPHDLGTNLGQGWYYPQTAKIVEVDRSEDTVTAMDSTGNLWVFNGCEDWEVDDFASLLMNSKGTSTIFDDEIVMTRYAGVFEG